MVYNLLINGHVSTESKLNRLFGFLFLIEFVQCCFVCLQKAFIYDI